MIEGFSIENLTFKEVKFEKLYLKWDKALLIRIDKMDLSDIKTDTKAITLEPLKDLPEMIQTLNRWVKVIDIKTIQYKTFKASLYYQKEKPGVILLRDGNISFQSQFVIYDDLFYWYLPEYKINNATLGLSLTVPLRKQTLYADMQLRFPNTPLLHVSAKGDNDSLSFWMKSEGKLRSIKEIVNFFAIDKETKPWILEYAKGSLIDLKHLSGTFHYNKPEELLQTLYAQLSVENAAYTFAKGFQPIIAKQVNLLFKKGVLYIDPIEGTFYNLPTEKSHLNINFTTSPNRLNIFIKTNNAMLNDPILTLLEFYGIKIPIKQESGKCMVDLNLSINLNSLETTAHGVFKPSRSDLRLYSIPLTSENGIVYLNNTSVRFIGFNAFYDQKIDAFVDGFYNASSNEGEISVKGYRFKVFNDPDALKLWDTASPLEIKYILGPKRDFIRISPSIWSIHGKKLILAGANFPFDSSQGDNDIPSFSFQFDTLATGNLKGRVNLNKEKGDMDIHFDHINVNDIKLYQPFLEANLTYADKKIDINFSDISSWNINEQLFYMSPFFVNITDNLLSVHSLEFIVNELFKGKADGHYDFQTKLGQVNLQNIVPINRNLTKIVDSHIPLEFTIDGTNDVTEFVSNTLQASLSYETNGWKLVCHDINTLSQYSVWLRNNYFTKGNITLRYSPTDNIYTINGLIDYPYAIIIDNNEAIQSFAFQGNYRNGVSKLNVNDKIRIHANEEKMTIQSERLGVNIPELIRMLSSKDSETTYSPTKGKETLPIKIELSDSYLQLAKNRRLISDGIEAVYQDNKFNVTLLHKEGMASVLFKNGNFLLKGEQFNDQFIKELIRLEDLYGGIFSFHIYGNSETFDGIIRVNDSILKNYKLLNNILAFVNTIPSLATFSLPNYNSKGLPIEEGYAHFHYNQSIVNVDNLTLNSPEIKLIGQGQANIEDQRLSGQLTLKTDLGSTFGKIPMVGYLLFGDDGSIATTLNLSGFMDNPQIETSIAKEIISTPFNILKRTLNYPISWIDFDTNQTLSTNHSKE